MEHEELDFGGDDLKYMLEKQIALETEALERCKRMIATTSDQEVVGVLKHVLDEERRPRREFRDRLP